MSRSSSDCACPRWAAPSWVIPGSVAANAEFLAGRVPAVGLCFYESAACLRYGAGDLPDAGYARHLSWHIHLPVDLPWQAGAEQVADIAAILCAKAAFLHPQAAVLHPPGGRRARKLLARFMHLWDSSVPVALENVACSDVVSLGLGFLAANDFKFCLDVAHAFTYGQWQLLQSPLVAEAILWHWSAPGDGDRHRPLAGLSPEERKKAKELMGKARKDAVHLLEIFDWQGVENSLPILADLAEC